MDISSTCLECLGPALTTRSLTVLLRREIAAGTSNTGVPGNGKQKWLQGDIEKELHVVVRADDVGSRFIDRCSIQMGYTARPVARLLHCVDPDKEPEEYIGTYAHGAAKLIRMLLRPKRRSSIRASAQAQLMLRKSINRIDGIDYPPSAIEPETIHLEL